MSEQEQLLADVVRINSFCDENPQDAPNQIGRPAEETDNNDDDDSSECTFSDLPDLLIDGPPQLSLCNPQSAPSLQEGYTYQH